MVLTPLRCGQLGTLEFPIFVVLFINDCVWGCIQLPFEVFFLLLQTTAIICVYCIFTENGPQHVR